MIPEDFKFEEGQVFELNENGETEIAKAEYDKEGNLLVKFIIKDVFVYLLNKDGTTVSNAVFWLNEQGVKFVSQKDYITSDINTNLTPSYHIVTENIQLSQLAECLIQQLTIELDRCKESTEKYNKLKILFDNND